MTSRMNVAGKSPNVKKEAALEDQARMAATENIKKAIAAIGYTGGELKNALEEAIAAQRRDLAKGESEAVGNAIAAAETFLLRNPRLEQDNPALVGAVKNAIISMNALVSARKATELEAEAEKVRKDRNKTNWIILGVFVLPLLAAAMLVWARWPQSSNPTKLSDLCSALLTQWTPSELSLTQWRTCFLPIVERDQLGGHHETTFKTLLCGPAFAFVELALGIAFMILTWVAVHKYLQTRGFWTDKDAEDLSDSKTAFHQLGARHKTLAQLWFTISLAILCAGLIYIVFHVMEVPCGVEPWRLYIENRPTNGAEVWSVGLHFLPNLFLYSIFFLGYTWSLKNYHAHWHNFVTNEHRYASLAAIEQMPRRLGIPANQDGHRILADLAIQSAAVVLMPSDSAYLDGGSGKGLTSGERLLKIEEAIRAMTTHQEKHPP